MRMTFFVGWDLFDWFRLVLGWIVGVYATVITLQSLWGWYAWLAGSDRYMTILRRYLILHGLRLRFGTFWGDVIISLLLTVVFFILWHAHHVIYDLGNRLQSQRAALASEAQRQSIIDQRIHKNEQPAAQQR